MKKTFLLFVTAGLISFSSMAAETVLFSGDKTTSLFSRMDIIDWAMGETKTNGNYVNFGTDDAPAFTEIADNPLKTGINTSDKALHMYSLKNHSWWPDFLIMTLAEQITVTEENRYLHVYHYRENLNKGFTLYLTSDASWAEDADKGTKRFDLDLSTAGVWEDVVVDLKWFIENQQPLASINFLVDRNWGNDSESATHYYWDEIVLNNSSMPRGVKVREEKEMNIFVGNEASYTNWVGSLDLQNSENTSSIVANPFTSQTAVLNSASVLKFNKSENASWWQGGPRFVLNGTMAVGVDGAPTFMHVMVNIPEIKDGKEYYVVQLNAKDFSGKQLDSGTSNKYWADDKGKWVDCVMDVTSLGYVSEVSVRFDVRRDDADNYINSPAGEFYLDAIALNGSEAPREKVTGKTKTGIQNLKVYACSRMIVVEGQVEVLDIYSVSGQKIDQVKSVANRTEVQVAREGVYVVKATLADRSVMTSKLIVR